MTNTVLITVADLRPTFPVKDESRIHNFPPLKAFPVNIIGTACHAVYLLTHLSLREGGRRASLRKWSGGGGPGREANEGGAGKNNE